MKNVYIREDLKWWRWIWGLKTYRMLKWLETNIRTGNHWPNAGGDDRISNYSLRPLLCWLRRATGLSEFIACRLIPRGVSLLVPSPVLRPYSTTLCALLTPLFSCITVSTWQSWLLLKSRLWWGAECGPIILLKHGMPGKIQVYQAMLRGTMRNILTSTVTKNKDFITKYHFSGTKLSHDLW